MPRRDNKKVKSTQHTEESPSLPKGLEEALIGFLQAEDPSVLGAVRFLRLRSPLLRNINYPTFIDFVRRSQDGHPLKAGLLYITLIDRQGKRDNIRLLQDAVRCFTLVDENIITQRFLEHIEERLNDSMDAAVFKLHLKPLCDRLKSVVREPASDKGGKAPLVIAVKPPIPPPAPVGPSKAFFAPPAQTSVSQPRISQTPASKRLSEILNGEVTLESVRLYLNRSLYEHVALRNAALTLIKKGNRQELIEAGRVYLGLAAYTTYTTYTNMSEIQGLPEHLIMSDFCFAGECISSSGTGSLQEIIDFVEVFFNARAANADRLVVRVAEKALISAPAFVAVIYCAFAKRSLNPLFPKDIKDAIGKAFSSNVGTSCVWGTIYTYENEKGEALSWSAVSLLVHILYKSWDEMDLNARKLWAGHLQTIAKENPVEIWLLNEGKIKPIETLQTMHRKKADNAVLAPLIQDLNRKMEEYHTANTQYSAAPR